MHSYILNNAFCDAIIVVALQTQSFFLALFMHAQCLAGTERLATAPRDMTNGLWSMDGKHHRKEKDHAKGGWGGESLVVHFLCKAS